MSLHYDTNTAQVLNEELQEARAALKIIATEKEKTEAANAAMRAALEDFIYGLSEAGNSSAPIMEANDAASALLASLDAGKGWISPAVGEQMAEALRTAKLWIGSTLPTGEIQKALAVYEKKAAR